MNCTACGAEVESASPAPAGTAACPRCGAALALHPETQAGATAGSGIALSQAAAAAPAAGAAPAAPPFLQEFGRYRLLAPLGVGGMGMVWKAWDTGLERTVALKQIRHEGPADAEALARFLREARLAARLRHPNIVAVHDVGAVAGQHYLTMDYVEGRTLAAALEETAAAKRARAPDALARLPREVALLAAVAEAVAFAHDQGVVHRDLKPGNVLLDREGRPLVMDFGLAKEVLCPERVGALPAASTQMTLGGQLLGTPAYMSPEQAAGDPARIGPRTDVWALGAMLYELLAGRLPFEGDSTFSILSAVVRNEPVAPTRRDPRVPPDLEAVCLRALEKDPAQRTARAGDFAADLRAWGRGEPVRARRPAAGARAWRWVRRRRREVAAAALAVLLPVLVLGWAASERARSGRRVRTVLAQIAAAVETFEAAVMRTELTETARRDLAAQPLGLLDRLIADDPGFGAAYAWRGRVKDLLQDPRGAEADYDRGCALTPGHGVVWLLRGLHRIDRTAAACAIVQLRITSMGVQVMGSVPLQDGSEALRRDGLADLDTALRAAPDDASLRATDIRFGRAVAVLHTGGTAGFREALRLLEGFDAPRALALRSHALYHLARYDEAVAAMDRVLADWPRDNTCRMMRGAARWARAFNLEVGGADPREEYHRSIEDLTEALRQAPQDQEVQIRRGSVYFCLGRSQAARGEDPRASFRSALLDYQECLKRQPQRPEALTGVALTMADAADWAAGHGQDTRAAYRMALTAFDRALRGMPFAETFKSRGLTWHHLGNAEEVRGEDPRESYRRAIADCSEALRRDPAYVAPYASRGAAWQSLGEAEAARGADPQESFTQALADLDEAVRRQPENGRTWASRAALHRRLGQAEAAAGRDPTAQYARAIADYDEALRRSPDLAVFYNNRGNAHKSLGDAKGARQQDARADYGRAVADFDAALRRNPLDPLTYNNRATAYRRLARLDAAGGTDPLPLYARAVADLDEALRLNPAYADACYNRGVVHFDLGTTLRTRGHDPRPEYTLAAKDYERALQLNPRHDAARRERADTLRLLADLETASRAAAATLQQAWGREVKQAATAMEGGDYATARTGYERALAALERAFAGVAPAERDRRMAAGGLGATVAGVRYNLACIEALASAGQSGPGAPPLPLDAGTAAAHRARAFDHLESAVRLGWRDAEHLRADPDLAPLRDDPRFEAIEAGAR